MIPLSIHEGDDEKRCILVSMLQQSGVDISNVQYVTKHSDCDVDRIKSANVQSTATSATIIHVQSNGDRPCLHQRGASDYLNLSSSDIRKIMYGDIGHGAIEQCEDNGSGFSTNANSCKMNNSRCRSHCINSFDGRSRNYRNSTVNKFRASPPSIIHIGGLGLVSGCANEQSVCRLFRAMSNAQCFIPTVKKNISYFHLLRNQ